MTANYNRLTRVLDHLTLAQPAAALSTAHTAAKPRKPSEDDIVIVSAVRTPIGRSKRGNLKDTYAEDLLAVVLKATLARTKIDPKLVGDIVVGSVLGNNVQRATEVRMAGFMAGFPYTVPVRTVNRQCSSGLQAIADVAASITNGYYDIGVAAGVETMSLNPQYPSNHYSSINPRILMDEQVKECMMPMGITSENVAADYKISRREQDELATRSHQRAAAAIKAGKFKDEIVPVTTIVKDEKTGTEREVTVVADEGVRPDTTVEVLAKLKPSFSEHGSTTAGNSSPLSDGASALLLMKRKTAAKLGLTASVMGVFRSFAAVGVPPRIMGVGPVFAIPEALNKAGLTKDDIDLYEINEAFASQASYCVKTLGLSWDRVNVNGGAIALGHPLGCTGARLTTTILYEMKKRNARFGVVSMCMGSGMGAAAVIERV